MTDLIGKFQAAVQNTMDFRGRPAKVGRPDGAIYVTAENGDEYKDRIWVTYTDDETQLNMAIVDRGGVPPMYGMPIRVINRRKVPTAEIDDSLKMSVYSGNGESVPVTSHNHYLEGPNAEYVEGLRFMPIGAHPSSPPALTVYIEPAFYRYLGTTKAWEGGNTGSLSSYVPVVDDGRIHFVIIALDRSDNTIDIIDGADVPMTGTVLFPVNAFVDYDDVLAISMDGKYYPIAVVELMYGQTTVLVKHITYDARLWAGEVPNSLDIDSLTEDTSPDPTADYLVAFDASAGVNKKVLPENMPGIKGGVTVVFLQTADGTAGNTTTPTDLLSTGIGSVTIPANTFETGTMIRVFMAGYISTDVVSPTLELSIDLGGSQLGTIGANLLSTSLTNVGWRAWIDIVCRGFPAAGSFVVSGVIRLGASLYGIVNTSTTSLDPTDPLQLEFFATWGTADTDNTITCQIATIELLPILGL